MDIKVTKKIRVLICSDAKNEADDQFAIAHALLTPKFDIVGMVAGHFGQVNSTQQSWKEMIRLATLTDTLDSYPIVMGASEKLTDNQLEENSTGADLIIATAHKSDPRPLFIVCLGTLTDMAIALLKEPDIAKRLTIIWVGGGRYPAGSAEANLNRDLHAANIVFSSPAPLWQIPSQAYKTILAPVAELSLKLNHSGQLGHYLYQQLVDFANQYAATKPWINSECWVLGDSGGIGVLLDEQKGNYTEQTPPYFLADGRHDMVPNRDKRRIRVYSQLNVRMILADMYAKIILFDRRNKEGSDR